jgi:serine-type D-Ala-D-Ala carboxypeptidase
MNSKEKSLQKFLRSEVVPDSTEGVAVRVRKGGRIVADVKAGKTYKYYDLASLTKIIFTNSAMMIAHDREQFRLNQSIDKELPWFRFRNIIIKDIMSHSAGMTWWKPIYKQMSSKLSVSERWELLKKILNSEKPKKQKQAVYSDLDYFLLAFFMEKIYQKPLLDIWSDVQGKLELSGLHFCVGNQPKFSRNLYAPTESCPWRKKTLRGEVHDDNTWSLGGVSSHAGLFGSIDEVDEWFLSMRASYFNKGPIASKTLKKFWSRAIPSSKGDWALGYMMPSKGHGSFSSAGKYFSKKSIGHTGFTGTSFWYDPVDDFSVTVLSNRVHPTRNNSKFIKLRPIIHDLCWELFNR